MWQRGSIAMKSIAYNKHEYIVLELEIWMAWAFRLSFSITLAIILCCDRLVILVPRCFSMPVCFVSSYTAVYKLLLRCGAKNVQVSYVIVRLNVTRFETLVRTVQICRRLFLYRGINLKTVPVFPERPRFIWCFYDDRPLSDFIFIGVPIYSRFLERFGLCRKLLHNRPKSCFPLQNMLSKHKFECVLAYRKLFVPHYLVSTLVTLLRLQRVSGTAGPTHDCVVCAMSLLSFWLWVT